MAETGEPPIARDESLEKPDERLRGVGSQQRHAAESPEQRTEKASADVPRGPNTPDSLEQPHDLGNIPPETGIHMHPASLTLPEEDLELTEGDEPTIP